MGWIGLVNHFLAGWYCRWFLLSTLMTIAHLFNFNFHSFQLSYPAHPSAPLMTLSLQELSLLAQSWFLCPLNHHSWLHGSTSSHLLLLMSPCVFSLPCRMCRIVPCTQHSWSLKGWSWAGLEHTRMGWCNEVSTASCPQQDNLPCSSREVSVCRSSASNTSLTWKW